MGAPMYIRDGEYRAPPALLRQLLDMGETRASIARMHGVEEHRVAYRCRRLGIGKPNGRAPNAQALAMALAHTDIPIARIAAAYGCKPSTIAKAAARHGLPTDERGREALRESRS